MQGKLCSAAAICFSSSLSKVAFPNFISLSTNVSLCPSPEKPSPPSAFPADADYLTSGL